MIILVPTCKSYSDAWEPFQLLMEKFWPDRKYPHMFVTDFLDVNSNATSIISMQEDLGWCKNLYMAIDDLEDMDMAPEDSYDFILVLQEDFFFNAPVDNSLVESALEVMKKDSLIGMVRLMPCPGPDFPYDSNFGIIDVYAPYRVSCQASIWRKPLLMELLNSVGNSPADFEINGSKSSLSRMYTFLSSHRSNQNRFSYFVSAINRGQWNPQAVQFCKDNGIPIDASRRPIEGSPS